MEKPGIEPATPGLQGIALIHYTTGAFSTFIVNITSVVNMSTQSQANASLLSVYVVI